MANKNSTDSKNKPIFTLQNIKDTLLESFDEKFAHKLITIKGIVQLGEYKPYIIDEYGNKLEISFHDKDKEDDIDDSDSITIYGYLNLNYNNDDRLMHNSGLKFNFNIMEIIDVDNLESKMKCLKRELENKQDKPTTPTDYLSKLLYEGKRPKLLILCSDTGMNDLKQGLSDKENKYSLIPRKAPLSSVLKADELTKILKDSDNEDFDAVVIARGGNDDYSIFLEHSVYCSIINMKTYILAGIGHTTLKGEFLKIFDHVELTPNEFGHYLRNIAKNVEAKKKKELYINVFFAIVSIGAILAAFFLF